LEAERRKLQSTHKGMHMGQLSFIHSTVAKAFSTFAKLFFSEFGLLCTSSHACLRIVVFSPVAQWMNHRPTGLGIAGSSPAGVILLVAAVGRHAAPSRLRQSFHHGRGLSW
jgi:hypothetical protein